MTGDPLVDPGASVDLHGAPLARTAGRLRNGELDPVAYADELCDRLDDADPRLRALLDESGRRSRLRDEAAELRERFPDPEDRPPLFGIPVGIKDIIHVDGFETRAGTALPPELFAGPEAACVERLRDAGALVFGKTATSEFAGAAPALTRNPHDLAHTPGGSSSGSAAAVATGLCPLALGTQTQGSVIRPAAFCGAVGFKPSFGRVPRDGVIERSASADQVGTFTQDVAGARLAASVLCDEWEGDVADGGDPDDRGLPAIGVPEGEYLDRATGEGRAAFEAGVEELERAGCRIERVHAFEEFGALDRRHVRLTGAELALVHEEWFDEYEPFYRVPTAERIKRGREVTDGQLAEARESRIELRERLSALMAEHDLDVWAAPAAPGPAPETIRSTGDPVMNRPWTHAGLPVVSLPIGKADNGLPLAIQFAGRFGADEELLAHTETIEGAL